MPRFERLPREGIEGILAEKARERALLHYLELVKLKAQRTKSSVLEIIGSDLERATNGLIGLRHREKPPEPKTEPKAITVYSFPTPYGGDLIYDPQRHTAVSPLLPEGTPVHLSPLEGLFLETFMKDPTAVHTIDELAFLLRENLSQAPVSDESNRVKVNIFRLRKKLGEPARKNGVHFAQHCLIHTTPRGYSLVLNLKYRKPQKISF